MLSVHGLPPPPVDRGSPLGQHGVASADAGPSGPQMGPMPRGPNRPLPAARAGRRGRGDRPRPAGRRSAGERLRVDVVADDVVRLKISRGGDVRRGAHLRGLRRPARAAGRVRRSSAATTSSGCAPPRWSCPSGSTRSASTCTAPTARAVVETAADADGRYVGVRHAQRRLRAAPPVPARGRRSTGWGRRPAAHNRRGRDFTLWNTDVLDPEGVRRVHPRAGPGRPARGQHEHRVRPVLRLDPVLLPPGLPGRRDGRARSSTTATARRTTSPTRTSTSVHFDRRPVHASTSSPGRGMPAILEAYTWLTGRTAPPPLWALGYHQCRWFDYTQDAVEALGHAAPRARDPVRRAVARHRLHGRLPRLHLEHRAVPGRARHARAPAPTRASG